MGYDWYGPQFFFPLHCLKSFDYQKGNTQFSNWIAVVGEHSNLTDSVVQYYLGVTHTIRKGARILAIPKYKGVDYASQAELEEYISSPEYKSDKKHSGICMGIEHIQDPDNPKNFTFKLYYPDQPIGRSVRHYEQAIPLQSNPVWSPFISSPNYLAYAHYQH